MLDIPSLSLKKGLIYALVGPSGSGKSTLLSLLAGLETASEGSISLFGKKLEGLTKNDRAEFRLNSIGFIFQNFQLIDHLTAFENVTLPAELLKIKDFKNRGKALLDKVGLTSRITHFPSQLSGGEQQRVALARAFISTPEIILADEPTGNLDYENSKKIHLLLTQLCRESGTTVIVATHNLEFAATLDRKVELKAGMLCAN